MYFAINTVISQVGCWIAAYLYNSNYHTSDEAGTHQVDGGVVFFFLGGMLWLWLICVLLFFKKIKRAYWGTFYSTQTGGQNTRSYFLDNDDERTKVLVFKRSIDLWKGIEGEVQVWTSANWPRWEEEQPEWFTAGFKESVPDHMIPKASLDKLNRNGVGGKRRRSSVSLEGSRLALESSSTSNANDSLAISSRRRSETVSMSLEQRWIEDGNIDATTRASIKSTFADPFSFSVEEKRVIEIGVNTFEEADRKATSVSKMKKFNTKTPLSTASVLISEKDHHSYGKISCVVRAPAVDVVAYNWDFESRYFKKYLKEAHVVKYCIIERVNSHHNVLYYRGQIHPPFQDRDFVWSFVWKQLRPDQYICVLNPTTHKTMPPAFDAVRGETTRVFRITEMKPGVSKYELIFHVDLKSAMPSNVVENSVMPASMLSAANIQMYFLQMKTSGDFDDDGEDGKMMGQLLMDLIRNKSVGGDERDEEIVTFCRRTAALREISTRYSWFEVLIVTIIGNAMRPVSSNQTSLESFTNSDALKVGRSLAFVLGSSLTHDAAVDEFMMTFPAMKALDLEFRMFRPFLLSIAKCLLEKSDWGMRMRVWIGALLSVLDMITDTNMIMQFLKQGQASAAYATIAMIALNLSVQLFVVYAQNKRKRRAVILFEMLIVLSFLKPGVDAYRVIKGGEKDPLLTMDPLTEMTMSKLLEVGLESVG